MYACARDPTRNALPSALQVSRLPTPAPWCIPTLQAVLPGADVFPRAVLARGGIRCWMLGHNP